MRHVIRPRHDQDLFRLNTPIPLRLRAGSGLPAKLGPALTHEPGGQGNHELLEAFGAVSRRIQDLARELKCLGYFDDDNDRPRAA